MLSRGPIAYNPTCRAYSLHESVMENLKADCDEAISVMDARPMINRLMIAGAFLSP